MAWNTPTQKRPKCLHEFDEQQIRTAIDALHYEGETFEIRLYGKNGYTASGYFNNVETAINALYDFQCSYRRDELAKSATITITLNPCINACMSRQQADKIIENAKPTTSDSEIAYLRWFLIDLDSKRLSGTSSTDDELESSKRKADEIIACMAEKGFKQPIKAMSGNGIHLVYRMEDVENTAENIAIRKNALNLIADKFSDDAVDVDRSVYNPARVLKLWGTYAQKGADTAERPHRQSYIEQLPDVIESSPISLLQAIIDDSVTTSAPIEQPEIAVTATKTAKTRKLKGRKWDLKEDFLERYSIPIRQVENKSDGTYYILENCLFDSSHGGKDAAIIQKNDGTLCYHCFHNSCSDKHWSDVRLLFEPDYKEKQTPKQDKGSKKADEKPPLEDFKQFEDFIESLGYEIKYNVITHKYEFYGFDDAESTEHLAEVVPSILYDALRKRFTDVSRISIADYITRYATRHKYNPILDMIKATEWDGTDRLEQLYDILKLAPATSPEGFYNRTFLKKWLMQCVCGLFNDIDNPFSLDIVLVFKGKQGMGKTRFMEKLALSPKYFGEGVCLDPRNKDTVIDATSKWICELGELGSTMKKDTDIIKAFITKSTDEYRTPYGRASLHYPRMTSFVGTVNDEQFLIDQTGNRRFVTIPLDDSLLIDYETQVKPFDALQLWTQIYNIVKDLEKSSCFRLTTAEKLYLEERNKNYVKPMKGELEVRDVLLSQQTADDNYIIEFKNMTVSEFIKNNDLRFEVNTVSKVLNKLGYKSTVKKVNGVTARLYTLPCKTWKKAPHYPEPDYDALDNE